MKIINRDNTTGGRPLFVNDILTVEENFYKHSQAQFQGRGAFIISGVIPTEGAISQGVVIIDNEVMSFEGTTGISFPVYLIKETSYSDNVVFQDGATKPLYIENRAVISTTIPESGEYISISASGGKRYTDVLMNDLVGLKGNQTVSGNKTFNNNVIVGGVNVKEEINKKANAIQENWKNLVLINDSWEYSSFYGIPLPSYFKDNFGFVHLRGVIAGNSNQYNFKTVSVLPQGYRPDGDIILGLNTPINRISSNGEIIAYGFAINLQGISFRAA